MRPVRLSLFATAGLLIASAPSLASLLDAVEDPAPANLFVSPLGKDTWSGKRAEPDKDDGPFATVDRAKPEGTPARVPFSPTRDSARDATWNVDPDA